MRPWKRYQTQGEWQTVFPNKSTPCVQIGAVAQLRRSSSLPIPPFAPLRAGLEKSEKQDFLSYSKPTPEQSEGWDSLTTILGQLGNRSTR